MAEKLPQLDEHLPDLLHFVRTLAGQIEAGELPDGSTLRQRLRDFYTADRMESIENVAPGWQDMAACAAGATLDHVTQALIAMQMLPEYRQGSRELRALLEWTVLYHDLGKRVMPGERDALHPFRSATIAARALPGVGFAVTDIHRSGLDSWTQLVLGASVAAADGKGRVQDNRALQEILRGLDDLFGARSPAALIVQAVLLHQSLDVVPEWPNPGSLTEAELSLYIRPSLLPLLEAMMLVDSDAWQLFDPVSRTKFRHSTLAVFANVRRLLQE